MTDDGNLLSPDQLAMGGNRLLAAANRADLFELCRAGARRVVLVRDQQLARATVPAAAVFFVEDGIASMVRSEPRGRRTEICLIGPEGFVGSAVVLADGRCPYDTFVSVDQLRAVRVGADAVRDLFAGSASFRHLLTRAIHMQTVQIAEALASAAWQHVDARLARWLLMCRDRLGTDHIPVTHEFMALMVGAQRTKITAALHEIEAVGAISASRGLVVVRDARQLRELADGGYGVAEEEATRLGLAG